MDFILFQIKKKKTITKQLQHLFFKKKMSKEENTNEHGSMLESKNQLYAMESVGIMKKVRLSIYMLTGFVSHIYLPSKASKSDICKYLQSLLCTDQSKKILPIHISLMHTVGREEEVENVSDMWYHPVVVLKCAVDILDRNALKRINTSGRDPYDHPSIFFGNYPSSCDLFDPVPHLAFRTFKPPPVPGTFFGERAYQIEPLPAITADEMKRLRSAVDLNFRMIRSEDVLEYKISLSMLDGYISLANINRLLNFHFNIRTGDRYPVEKVFVRRTRAHPGIVDWHVDTAKVTMTLALNGQDEYEGGRIIYIQDGKPIMPNLEAGSILVHSNMIAYGVTRQVAGMKYELCFVSE